MEDEKVKEEVAEAVEEVNKEEPKKIGRKSGPPRDNPKSKAREKKKQPEGETKEERQINGQKTDIIEKMDDRDLSGAKVNREIRFIKQENGKRYFEIDEIKGGKVVATKKRVFKIT